MPRIPLRAAAASGACLLLATGLAMAQERQVYRYVDSDGRVVYSDRVPTAGAKDVQAKRVVGNTIETSTMSLALQQATDRFPVTLYTFNCGDTCDRATALLNRRGVPHQTVNVEEGTNAQKLQQLTGELVAPVLQVGDKLLGKGFHEAQWHTLLDQAGYPKTPATRSSKPLGRGEAADEPAAAPRAQAAR